MKPRDYGKIGLPKGHSYLKLAYHPPTGSVIVHTRAIQSELPCRRLSLKRANRMRYRPVADFPPSISIENALLHPRLPRLYFITYAWRKFLGREPGGDWDALYCFDLKTRKAQIMARDGDLVLPNGYQKAWLSELLATSDDDRAVFCKVGFVTHEKSIRYLLSKISLVDKKIQIVGKLKWAFV